MYDNLFTILLQLALACVKKEREAALVLFLCNKPQLKSMSSTDHLSPIFSHKSKSSGENHLFDDHLYGGDPSKTPFDIIEHDVAILSQGKNLPPPDSFDALQIGSER